MVCLSLNFDSDSTQVELQVSSIPEAVLSAYNKSDANIFKIQLSVKQGAFYKINLAIIAVDSNLASFIATFTTLTNFTSQIVTGRNFYKYNNS